MSILTISILIGFAIPLLTMLVFGTWELLMKYDRRHQHVV